MPKTLHVGEEYGDVIMHRINDAVHQTCEDTGTSSPSVVLSAIQLWLSGFHKIDPVNCRRYFQALADMQDPTLNQKQRDKVEHKRRAAFAALCEAARKSSKDL